MDHRISERLQTLKAEFSEGEKLLADLQARQITLRDQLLRISGAIQVLEELMPDEHGAELAKVHRLASSAPHGS